MHNRLEELHRRCRNYHIKRFAKLALLPAAVAAVVVTGYLYDSGESETPQEVRTAVVVRAAPVTPVAVPAAEPVRAEAAVVQKTGGTTPPAETKKAAPTSPLRTQVKVEEAGHLRPAAIVQPVPKPMPLLQSSSENTLDKWIVKYREKPTYAAAVYIASEYYDRGDYEASLVWAKRANRLDKEQEEAWLLYARSIHARMEQEKAVKVLKFYLDYKESAAARNLLAEWGAQ